jgi:HlyD family secretion protein
MIRALFLIALVACSACLPKTNAESESGPRTVEVKSGTFKLEVTAPGKVQPNREVQVTSKASGEILELPYEAGDPVKKGDLLVRLDPDDEQRNVSRSEAQLRAAEARVSKARSELELSKSSLAKSLVENEAAVKLAEVKLAEMESRIRRQEQLYKERTIALETLDAARTLAEQARTELTKSRAVLEDTRNQDAQILAKEQEVKLAEVEVTNATIALDEARERLAETNVISPMDGVLTVRYVEPGFVISSAIMNVGGGTLLMIISDLSRLFVVATVDEADLGGIRVGQSVEIRADAFSTQVFTGEVTHIAPIGVEKDGVVNFDVKVEVEGEGLRLLKPGMTTDVTITVGEQPETMWIQSEAIQEGPDGPFIEIDKLGSTEKVPVKLGISDGLNTEIKDGAKAGQKVIVKARENSAWERD